MKKLPFGREKKITIQHSDTDVNNGPVQETLLIRQYSASKQLELGKAFKLEMKEPLTAWIRRLLDIGWMGESSVDYKGRN